MKLLLGFLLVFSAMAKDAKTEKDYDENLFADLRLVKQHHEYAKRFLEIYPKKYHKYLYEMLEEKEPPKTADDQKIIERARAPKHADKSFELEQAQLMMEIERQNEINNNLQLINSFHQQQPQIYSPAIPQTQICNFNGNTMFCH